MIRRKVNKKRAVTRKKAPIKKKRSFSLTENQRMLLASSLILIMLAVFGYILQRADRDTDSNTPDAPQDIVEHTT